MPYQKVLSAVAGLDSIAKTIAVPREHKPLRMPTFPALERTGILAFTDTTVITQGSGTNFPAAVVRDAAFPLWIPAIYTVANLPFSVFTLISNSTSNYEVSASGAVTLIPGDFDNLTFCGATTLVLPNGFPAIVKNGHKYLPLAGQYVGVEVTTSVNPGASSADIVCECITVDNQLELVETNSNAASGATRIRYTAGIEFSLDVDRYVAFRVTSIAFQTTNACAVNTVGWGVCTNTGSLTAYPLSQPQGVPGYVPMRPAFGPPEFATTTAPWKSTRCSAAAVLFSNVGKALNKEGTVSAGRVAAERCTPMAPISLVSTSINAVYPKDRYFGALENGLYTFTLPDKGSEVYTDYTQTSVLTALDYTDWTFAGFLANLTLINAVTFDLDKLTYVHLIEFYDSDATTSTQLAVTCDRHIEFRSSSALFPLGFSGSSLESYHMAQMALVQLGVFFENPVHLASIASAVGKALNFVKPMVMPALKSAMYAGADRALNMAKNKLGSMAQAKMVQRTPPPKPRQKRQAKTPKVSVKRK